MDCIKTIVLNIKMALYAKLWGLFYAKCTKNASRATRQNFYWTPMIIYKKAVGTVIGSNIGNKQPVKKQEYAIGCTV